MDSSCDMSTPLTDKKSVPAPEIARETIKQMAVRRVEPTPENYTLIYNEIAGIPEKEDIGSAIRKSLKQLPHDTSEQVNWINRWDKLLKQENWSGLVELMHASMDASVNSSKRWPEAIRGLLSAWDDKRMDNAKKRESLERVLINFGADDSLSEKIQNLANSWNTQTQGISKSSDGIETEGADLNAGVGTKSANVIQALNDVAPNHAAAVAVNTADANVVPEPALSVPEEIKQFHAAFEILQSLLKQSLQDALLPKLDGYPDLQDEAQAVLELAEKSRKLKDWEYLAKQLRALLVRVELIGAKEDDIKYDIINLLQLLLTNIGELVAEDEWLRGQVATVQTIVSGPLDRAQMQTAENSLKEVIYKQGLIKHSLLDAKNAFKSMVSTFIDRLKYMAESSGQYGEKIDGYALELSKTDDIVKINQLVEGLMRDTHTMQADIIRSRDAILNQREEAETAQDKVRKLQEELVQLSETVRLDQLTGVLNRRGLDEALITEMARFKRGGGPLSVALLDIDNFKQLNDKHGHQVGDIALKHLADVVKRTVRPTDVVTRLGGEEFVVLLPNTNLDEAIVAMSRLQRQMTKEYFLGNNEKLLITFSAGVALYKGDEDQISIIHRADLAMYLAKKTGKNKVMTELDL